MGKSEFASKVKPQAVRTFIDTARNVALELETMLDSTPVLNQGRETASILEKYGFLK